MYNIKKLRIDAAGYQASIIDYCFEHNIEFSIRAKMCQSLKDIFVDKDNQWQPLVDKKGKAIDGQATFRMRHFMGNNGKVFDLVVQRSSVTGQVELDLELDSNNSTQASEQITTGQYIYRSIATNLETLSDSKVIHFYNQRGEDSENRIKELKNDFGARQMPCILSYNLKPLHK